MSNARMKRLLALLLTVCLSVALSGCLDDMMML